MFKQETLIKKMFTFAGDDENYVQKGTKFYFFTKIACVMISYQPLLINPTPNNWSVKPTLDLLMLIDLMEGSRSRVTI